MQMKDTKTKTNERELRAVVVPQQYIELIKDNIPENKITEIYEGDKIVHEQQTEYKNTYAINFKKGDAFVKIFTDTVIDLFKEMSSKEFAVALAITPFISYKDGILRYNNKIADVRVISDVLQENYETFRRTISSLEEKGILAKVERQSDTYQNKTKKCIAVNPYIFLKGQDIEKDIINKFKDTKWANLQN